MFSCFSGGSFCSGSGGGIGIGGTPSSSSMCSITGCVFIMITDASIGFGCFFVSSIFLSFSWSSRVSVCIVSIPVIDTRVLIVSFVSLNLIVVVLSRVSCVSMLRCTSTLFSLTGILFTTSAITESAVMFVRIILVPLLNRIVSQNI